MSTKQEIDMVDDKLLKPPNHEPKLSDARLCGLSSFLVVDNYKTLTAKEYNIWKLEQIKLVYRRTIKRYTYKELMGKEQLFILTQYRYHAIEWLEAYVKQQDKL